MLAHHRQAETPVPLFFQILHHQQLVAAVIDHLHCDLAVLTSLERRARSAGEVIPDRLVVSPAKRLLEVLPLRLWRQECEVTILVNYLLRDQQIDFGGREPEQANSSQRRRP